MLTHLPRSAEVRRLYRKGLELSREFPDPCGRNYLMRRVQEVFRKRARETSPTKIGRHIKEGRQSVRRMERALHGREDYARVTQLAYGAVGRVKHLLAAADAELDAHHLPERRNRNRPPKFSLPPLEGEARETFTLGLLLRKIEQLNPHASRDENEDVAEPDAEAVRRQLEALRDSVPPPRRRLAPPRAKKRFREDGFPRSGTSREGTDRRRTGAGFPTARTGRRRTSRFCARRSGRPSRKRRGVLCVFRRRRGDHARRSSLPSASEEALRGRGTRTASLTDTDDERATRTENNDEKHEHTNTIPSLRRSWRRFYGAALGLDAAAPLMIENAPDAWSARGKDKKGDDDESASRPRVVLTHRGRAVDEFAA